MKAALICGGYPDYLCAVVLQGLEGLLGRGSVWSFVRVFMDLADPAFEPLRFAVARTNPSGWDWRTADVVVVCSREFQFRPAAQFALRERMAILDGEDDPLPKRPESGLAHVCFKRETRPHVSYAPHVRQLSFAPLAEVRPESPNRHPRVFFHGWPVGNRQFFINCMTREPMAHIQLGRGRRDEYRRALSESLVGWAPCGAGRDTYRFWEVIFFGAALLAERTGLATNDSLMNGREAVFYSTPEEMVEGARMLMSDPEGARAMASNATAALEAGHLPRHRAAQVLREFGF